MSKNMKRKKIKTNKEGKERSDRGKKDGKMKTRADWKNKWMSGKVEGEGNKGMWNNRK